MKSILVALVLLVCGTVTKAETVLPITERLMKVFAYDNVRNVMGVVESDMVNGTSILFDKQVNSFREARTFLRTLSVQVSLDEPDTETPMTYILMLKDGNGQTVLQSQKTTWLVETDGNLMFAGDAFRLPRLSVAENINIPLNWAVDRIKVVDSFGSEIGGLSSFEAWDIVYGTFPYDLASRYPNGSLLEFQFDGYESIYASIETGKQVNPPVPLPAPEPEFVSPGFGELEVEGLLDLTSYLEQGVDEITVSITEDTVIVYNYGNSQQRMMLHLDADGVLVDQLDRIVFGDTHVYIETVLGNPETGIQSIQLDGDLEEVGVNHFYLLRTIRR